jgi:radical SAM superfamily enzyme with C-terminal helix-hairpin-helix motif
MHFTIIDCYTDEPSGLGVYPTLGTYPRYLAGAILEAKQDYSYLTIDDVRATIIQKEGKKLLPLEKEIKTNIKIRNRTHNFGKIELLLKNSDVIIIIAGVHTPGKYLSAYPGTTKEISSFLKKLRVNTFTVLTGPAAHAGSGLWGGKKARAVDKDKSEFNLIIKDIEYKIKELIDNNFTETVEKELNYSELRKKAMLGADLVTQLPHQPEFLIAEVETMRGCAKKVACSFCTEKLKSSCLEKRPLKDIVDEVKALSHAGLRNVRLGKQTCFYSYGTDTEIEQLLKSVSKYTDILHIDNVNPAFVNEAKTKSIVKYCSSGNIAAMGVESFDPDVVKKNCLNCNPSLVMEKIKLINKLGADRGPSGMPKFLPGINIIFGLLDESKKTHQHNMEWLQKISDEGLMLRRINVREVVVFPGTQMAAESGDKFLKKNRKYYWKWRNDIRQNIDNPMLKRVVPEGTILRKLRTEIYDGNTTFARQVGTYPLVVGIKGRIELDKFVDVKITGHMLRSLVGEVV